MFHGVVTFISPTVDPATRTLRIKAEIDNDEGHLRPGLFARVSLGVAPRSGVVMVPEEALIQRSEGAVLFKIDAENRVKRVTVTTGAHDAGRVEVRGDVRAGRPRGAARPRRARRRRAVAVRDAEPRAVAAQQGDEAEGAEL